MCDRSGSIQAGFSLQGNTLTTSARHAAPYCLKLVPQHLVQGDQGQHIWLTALVSVQLLQDNSTSQDCAASGSWGRFS